MTRVLSDLEDEPYVIFDRDEFIQFLRELALESDDILNRKEIDLPLEVVF